MKSAFNLCLFLLLFGCSESSQESKVNPLTGERCLQPEKGDAAVKLTAKTSRNYFSKEIDLSKLDAVAKASSLATSRYMGSESDGRLQVFRVREGEGSSCRSMGHLSLANSALHEKWDSVEELFQEKDSDTSLAGLYVPEFDAAAVDYILVRTDVDRLTLLHEYMHFLYEQGLRARSDFVSREEFLISQVMACEYLEEMARGSSPEDVGIFEATEYAEIVEGCYETTVDLLKTSSLEEVAIEATLIKKHANNELDFLGDTPVIDYLQSQSADALKEIRSFKRLLQKLSGHEVERKVLGRLQKLENDIIEVRKSARRDLKLIEQNSVSKTLPGALVRLVDEDVEARRTFFSHRKHQKGFFTQWSERN